jgi:hypothetical protein
VDAQTRKAERREPDAADAPPRRFDGTVGRASYGPSRRLQEVTVPEALLFACLRAGTRRYVHNPPYDAHVVGCTADTSQRTIRLIIHSEDFAEVEEGKPIPELEREWKDGLP